MLSYSSFAEAFLKGSSYTITPQTFCEKVYQNIALVLLTLNHIAWL
jgi:hypothetical protein